MIVTGPENVCSTEVENVVLQHSAVIGCAVIGVSDEAWGERLHTVLALKSDLNLSLEELIRFCRNDRARKIRVRKKRRRLGRRIALVRVEAISYPP
jgi:long-chain acyl-CoA synthetase